MAALKRGKICQSQFAFDTRKFLETENGEWKGGRMSPDVGGQETGGQESDRTAQRRFFRNIGGFTEVYFGLYAFGQHFGLALIAGAGFMDGSTSSFSSK